MSTISTRKAAPGDNVVKARRSLSEQLLALEIKLEADLARRETLKTELKAIANETGESFKEEFAGRGSVAAAPKHPAEFKGTVPQIVTEKYLELKPHRQKQLVDQGVIELVQNWGKPFHGSVTVKLATEGKKS